MYSNKLEEKLKRFLLEVNEENIKLSEDREYFIENEAGYTEPLSHNGKLVDNIFKRKSEDQVDPELRVAKIKGAIVITQFEPEAIEGSPKIKRWQYKDSLVFWKNKVYFIDKSNDIKSNGDISRIYSFDNLRGWGQIGIERNIVSSNYVPKNIDTPRKSAREKKANGIRGLAKSVDSTQEILYLNKDNTVVDTEDLFFKYLKYIFELEEKGIKKVEGISQLEITKKDINVSMTKDNPYIFIKENGCRKYTISIVAKVSSKANLMVERYRFDINGKEFKAYEFIGNQAYELFDREALFDILIDTKFLEEYSVPLDDEDMVKDTMMSYFKDILEPHSAMVSLFIVINTMVFPHLEILYKGGFQKELSFLLTHSPSLIRVKHQITSALGRINETANSVKDIIGLNSYQIASGSKYMEDFYNNNILKNLKYIEGVRSLDNETTDLIIELLRVEWGQYVIYVIENLQRKVGFSGIKKNSDILLNIAYGTGPFISSLSRQAREDSRMNYNRSSSGLLGKYKDYLTMIDRAEDVGAVYPLFPKGNDELVRYHDELVHYINIVEENYRDMNAKERAHKFKEVSETLTEFEYKDGKYSIVIPTHPKDLAKEGISLNHCVKSYVDQFIKKTSIILFVRSSDNEEEPLYTLEVDKSRNILQFRGFANSNPPQKAYDFLEKWQKEKR